MTSTVRKIHELDATGIPLGRLASQVATLLIGKRKASFEPRLDGGDFVTIKNIRNVKVTGNKMTQKIYRHHSFHPGGLKEKVMKDLYATHPEKLLETAVSRMLPKNKHRKLRMMRLKVQ